MIKVTYDSEVDAKYVSIKKGKIHETKTIKDWLFFDVDKEGDVLGVEILNSSKNEVAVSTFENKLASIDFIQKDKDKKSLSKNYERREEYINSESAAFA